MILYLFVESKMDDKDICPADIEQTKIILRNWKVSVNTISCIINIIQDSRRVIILFPE